LLKKREHVSLRLSASLIIFQEESFSITENLSRDTVTSSQDEFHCFGQPMKIKVDRLFATEYCQQLFVECGRDVQAGVIMITALF
jgi:hypothetical protein